MMPCPALDGVLLVRGLDRFERGIDSAHRDRSKRNFSDWVLRPSEGVKGRRFPYVSAKISKPYGLVALYIMSC